MLAKGSDPRHYETHAQTCHTFWTKALKGEKASSGKMLSPLLRGRKVDRLYPGIREGGKCRRRKEGEKNCKDF